MHNFYSHLKLMLLSKEGVLFCSALLDVDSCHSSDRSSCAGAQGKMARQVCRLLVSWFFLCGSAHSCQNKTVLKVLA